VDIEFPSVAQLLAAAPVLGLLIPLATVWLSARAERRRSQPVVIVHKRGHVLPGKDVGHWAVGCVVKNEGGGPAFNVTFGVEIKCVRFAYAMQRDDPPSRQRVIASGMKLPEPDANRGAQAGMEPRFSLFLPSLDRLSLGKTSEEDEVYWARYENAHGHTWETRNSGDRAGELEIRRVWGPDWLGDWRHRRARTRLNRRGVEIEQMVARELEARLDTAPPPKPGLSRPSCLPRQRRAA